jgi:hypothetical protein
VHRSERIWWKRVTVFVEGCIRKRAGAASIGFEEEQAGIQGVARRYAVIPGTLRLWPVHLGS